jgi:hypothetical protein
MDMAIIREHVLRLWPLRVRVLRTQQVLELERGRVILLVTRGAHRLTTFAYFEALDGWFNDELCN